MVPGLPLDCLESRQLLVLLRSGFEQRYFPLLRDEEQQVLVREQEYLARAVASLFPFQFAFVEGDASELARLIDARLAALR